MGRGNKGKEKIEKNARRWTSPEVDCFAEILADDENSFAQALENLALKHSVHNHGVNSAA